MNISQEMETRIDRARAWLIESGCISGGGFRRFMTTAGELGPVSSEITGYGAHTFAWLFKISSRDSDRRLARGAGEWLVETFKSGGFVMPVEPDDKRLFFFDMGIAARGLYALWKAVQRPEFQDVSIALSTQMRYFGGGAVGIYDPVRATNFEAVDLSKDRGAWWSRQPGPYQRKAALIWRVLNTHHHYDDVDCAWLGRDELETGEAKTEKAKRESADMLHPFAYSIEAMLMRDASQERGAQAFSQLKVRIDARPDHQRTDVLAQFLRMHLLQGLPLPLALVDRLIDLQHASGGFHFMVNKNKLSADLSVHATLFAIQAMAMAQLSGTEACKFPGPLGRRELAIA